MPGKPRLLDQVRNKIRVKHYSIRTEKAYIHYHKLQHPKNLSTKHIEQFLTHLAVDKKVAASTQNLALSSILFLYKEVLEIDLSYLNGVT